MARLGVKTIVSQWIGLSRSSGNAASLQERRPRSRAARAMAVIVASESTTTAAHASARTSHPVAVKRYQSTSPPDPAVRPCCQKKQLHGPWPSNSGCRSPLVFAKDVHRIGLHKPREPDQAQGEHPDHKSQADQRAASATGRRCSFAEGFGHGANQAKRAGVASLKHFSSFRIFPAHEGQQQDLQIEPEGPVLDVINVVLDPLFQCAASAQAVHLRPAGHPRLDQMAWEIMGNRPGQPVTWRGRSGADRSGSSRHGNVPELRQLIDIPAAHESPDPEQARIAGPVLTCSSSCSAASASCCATCKG